VPVIVLASGSACSHTDNVLSVSNPEPGVTYLWSDGQTGQSITVTDAGPYYVEASNANGCSLVSNIVTIEPSAPVDLIPGGCFIACDPLTVCLPPLQDAISYVLFRDGLQIDSGSGFPSSITIDQDGSYTFEVTSANGCVATSDPLDVALYTGVGSVTVETWLDQDGDGMISAGDVLLPGIGVQIVSDDGMHQGNTETVPDGQFVFEDFPASGYTALIDRSMLPSQWTVLIDSVQTTISTCNDSVVVALLLTANCISTGPDVLIEACPGDTIAIGDSTWFAPGVYEAHLPGDSGCDSVFQVTIIPPDSVLITAEVWMDVDRSGTISAADTLVPGITIIFEESVSGVQTIGVTDNGGLAADLLPDAEYDVRVDTAALPPLFGPLIWAAVVADSSCGNAVVSFLLEPSCPAVYVIQPEVVCPGDSVLVQGVWISDPGSHLFTISDPQTGCDTVLEVLLSNYPALTITGAVDWNCIHQGSIDLALSGVPPLVIDWQPGGMTDSTVVGLAEGTYVVTVTDGNGCTSSEQFDVVASTPLSFSLPPSYTLTEGDSVWITISGDVTTPGLSFSWTPAGLLSCPSCPETWAFPLSDTTVTVVVTDADSCTYALETRLIVEISDLLYIPNVFSPNGDGINDRWTLYTRYPEAFVHELHVFDRWGDHIFSKTDFSLDSFAGWDGTFRGKPVNPGVFAYVARLTLSDGRTLDVKGDVTLLR
jgi:gliding motility-associated-like protein